MVFSDRFPHHPGKFSGLIWPQEPLHFTVTIP
jgi:hypothetical protein